MYQLIGHRFGFCPACGDAARTNDASRSKRDDPDHEHVAPDRVSRTEVSTGQLLVQGIQQVFQLAQQLRAALPKMVEGGTDLRP